MQQTVEEVEEAMRKLKAADESWFELDEKEDFGVAEISDIRREFLFCFPMIQMAKVGVDQSVLTLNSWQLSEEEWKKTFDQQWFKFRTLQEHNERLIVRSDIRYAG